MCHISPVTCHQPVVICCERLLDSKHCKVYFHAVKDTWVVTWLQS